MFLEISWLIPLTLFGVLPLIIILEYKKRYLGAIVAIIGSTISTIISIGAFIETLDGKEYTLVLKWISYKGIELSVGIYADKLALFMASIVSFISTLIMIYSLEYMSHDKNRSAWAWPRYFFEIAMFVGFMLMLVLSYSLLQLLIAWEGVGLCSYLLIGYWWWKPEASEAAKKAFITTRLGDVFFYAAIVYAYMAFQTLDIPKLNAIDPTNTAAISAAAVVGVFLFFAAVGKSAQIPLFTWLPWAMEGPTTVSALIHAATMVKAGVYLIARMYPMYMAAGEIWGLTPLKIVAYVGGLTAAFAGIVAVFNRDMKGVLAYSTISHLGLLMLGLGVLAYEASLYHLLNHAFFKAALFLVSGSVLHATNDTRNMFELGGLRNKMRSTFVWGLLGAWAISGFPPAGGFWSKEEILLGVLHTGDPVLLVLGFIAAVSSPAYIFRWISIIFFGEPKSSVVEHAHEAPLVMNVPMAVLAGGAIVWGIPNPLAGMEPIGQSFIPTLNSGCEVHTLALAESETKVVLIEPELLKVITLSVGIALAVIMLLIYVVKGIQITNKTLLAIQDALQQGTIIDVIYDKLAAAFMGALSTALYYVDKGIDTFYALVYKALVVVGVSLGFSQTGSIRDYVTWLLAGTIMLLLIITFVLM